jgi:hypothetical protein
MMMRYAPFISPLGDKHGETRWAGNWFAIDHPSKSVEASDHHCVIVDYDRAPLINRILITGSVPSEITGLTVPRRIASGQ